MASNDREVAKKAETILAQADRDGDGVVNFEEFVLVSKRFPNILYPSYTIGSKVAKNLGGE
jgi:serine/threonine-protein phosphatase 2B regulatory subunit